MGHLQRLFGTMCVIREVETVLLDLFAQGKLRGTVHTCIGQEACAVGVASVLERGRDVVYSNHRGHGHYIAFTGDVRGLVAEILGKADGVCGGVGGSQHLQNGNFYSNGILGAGLPVAVGMALAEKQCGSGAVAAAFVGDGTFGEGVVYEAMNMAALWSAPVLIVVEDNHYAQSTPSNFQHAGSLKARAEPFGIPVTAVDGNDVIAVQAAAAAAVAAIRATPGPRLLFLDTYRLAPHSKGDDFRALDEIAQARLRDPLARVRDSLGAEAGGIEAQVRRDIRELVAGLL